MIVTRCMKLFVGLAVAELLAVGALSEAAAKTVPPNIVVIFTDDQGYNDLGCFGSKTIKTPNIDRMAEEGRIFTSFYVPANVCTPSRSALMTGCYPKRIGMERGVIFPRDNHGLHTDEVTIADMLKTANYATACIGKWHLGHRKPFLPTSQGFDSYFGIPYSNDMAHPDNKKRSNSHVWTKDDKGWQNWHTPLMQNEDIAEIPVNQKTITRRYTDRAVEFIKENQKKSFFLYLAHSMPHVPLFVPDECFTPDKRKAYITVIEHIDEQVGRILDVLRELKLSQETVVIFTSDNGPWLPFGSFGGCAKPLRNGKGTTYEGGHRVPCVMWGPGRIPAGTSTDAFITSMDLLPSFAGLAGVELKTRGPIDGKDITAVMAGSDKSPRHEMLYYSRAGALHGLRQGDWKIRIAGKKELYNLKDDISESRNLAEAMPEKVESMRQRMNELHNDLSEHSRQRGVFSSQDKSNKGKH